MGTERPDKALNLQFTPTIENDGHVTWTVTGTDHNGELIEPHKVEFGRGTIYYDILGETAAAINSMDWSNDAARFKALESDWS